MSEQIAGVIIDIEAKLKARWYQAGVEAERHDIAKMVENYCGAWDDKGQALIQMIRSRGE